MLTEERYEKLFWILKMAHLIFSISKADQLIWIVRLRNFVHQIFVTDSTCIDTSVR
jgi:hypothetical protein